MSAAAKKKEESPTLRSHAAAALAAAGGNVSAATAALAERAMNDKAFLRAYYSEVIQTACYEAVASCVRQERRAVWTTPQPSTTERRAQVTALAAGTVSTLHDFPLPGGKRLGEATREEVAQAAEFFGRQARDMAWKSRWLEHVAQSVPAGKRVADVISAERLEELRQEVGQ